MKKSEFKQLIKESVREVLVTEGFLSTIVAEVVKGIGANSVRVLTHRMREWTYRTFLALVVLGNN